MNNKLKIYPQLNGVRAIAAFMVLLFHYFCEGPYPELVKKISIIGQTGVTLFFVLSGFLINRILLSERGSPNYFKTFYVRRILRIFPLYYLFLLLFYITNPILMGETSTQFAHPKWTFFFFLQNFPMTFEQPYYGPDHFWSLAVEEHFYLILPFVVFLLKEENLKIFLYSLIILAIIFRMVILDYGFEIYQFTLTVMDGLAIGALLAIYEKHKGFRNLNKNRLLKLVLFSLLILMTLWLALSSQALFLIQVVKFTLIALVFVSFILFVISSGNESMISRILSSKFMQFSGKISFGLYVFHPLCFRIINKFSCSQDVFIVFFMSFLTTFIVSALSFFLIETRFLRLKEAIAPY